MVDALFKFPKLSKDMAGINKIAKSLKADGPKKIKSGGTLPQRGLTRNMSQGKEAK